MTGVTRFGLLTAPSIGNDIFYSTFLTKENLTIYSEVKEYCQSTHQYKIAIIDDNINTPRTNMSLRERVAASSDYVILHNMEIDQSGVDYMLNQNNKFTYSINGVVNHPIDYIKSMEWFSSTANFYKNNLNFILAELKPFQEKQYCFDFLPGGIKPHRVAVMNYIQQNKLQDKIFCGKFFDGIHCDNYEDEKFWDEDIVKGSLDPDTNGHQVLFHGNRINLGQIIPRKIYNKSCYSIVSETYYDNSFSFYTEKTVKALLASRLFVMIAGQYYLRNLRQLGFQTFSNIIDENYDNIEDDETRWNEALKQVSFLCEQPQAEIIKKIVPIVTHNYRLIMSYDWITPLRDHIEDKFIAV